jgi:hypothetical protein
MGSGKGGCVSGPGAGFGRGGETGGTAGGVSAGGRGCSNRSAVLPESMLPESIYPGSEGMRIPAKMPSTTAVTPVTRRHSPFRSARVQSSPDRIEIRRLRLARLAPTRLGRIQ